MAITVELFAVTISSVVGVTSAICFLVVCLFLFENHKRRRTTSELRRRVAKLEHWQRECFSPEPYIYPISLAVRDESHRAESEEDYQVMRNAARVNPAIGTVRNGRALCSSDSEEDDFEYDYIVVDGFDRITTRTVCTIPNTAYMKVKLTENLKHTAV